VTAINGATSVDRIVEALKDRSLKYLEIMIIRPMLALEQELDAALWSAGDLVLVRALFNLSLARVK